LRIGKIREDVNGNGKEGLGFLKSRAWSVTSGLQLPTVRGSKLGSVEKILFEYDIVKGSKSLPRLSEF
jgi:hypothetical protein